MGTVILKRRTGDCTTIPEFLRSFRTSLGYSQESFATRIGVSRAWVSDAECGKYLKPMDFLRHVWPLLNENQRMHLSDILRQLDIDYLNSPLDQK